MSESKVTKIVKAYNIKHNLGMTDKQIEEKVQALIKSPNYMAKIKDML